MADLNVGFVLFPNVTQLDFTGPLQVLSRAPGAKVHIVAKTLEPVPSDCGLALVPTATFETCPQLDLLCVPGGIGVAGALADKPLVDFVRRQAPGARYVTSVCTGAFVLGAAGLLRGRRATTHWAFADLLGSVGAVHEKARCVQDGNVITAGGVTSGIDFALRILADIAGPEVAKSVQLGIEYDPSPPFDAGHPDRVTPEMRDAILKRYEPARIAHKEGAESALAGR